jgi:FkbM family methyltransferase
MFRLLSRKQSDARYNRDTGRILRTLRRDATCVDVGAASGALLRLMLEAAPDGHHYAFEARPEAAEALRRQFPTVSVHGIALGDRTGSTGFCVADDLPEWSGMRRQAYPRPDVRIREIEVPLDRLDNVIPPERAVHFMKIDVEGAESLVLRGAERICRRWAPLIVVEYGRAGRQQYGVEPRAFFEQIADMGLRISLVGDWLEGRADLSAETFEQACNTHWNFVAHP